MNTVENVENVENMEFVLPTNGNWNWNGNGKVLKSKRERVPLSMRGRLCLPGGVLEQRVKGWDTFAEEFVDFM